MGKPSQRINFYFQEGNDAFIIGDFRNAVAAYEKLLEISPDHYESLCNKAVALSSLMNFQAAVLSYEKALKVNSNDPVLWSKYGADLNNLGLYEEALISAEKAIEIAEEHSYAWFVKGFSLFRLGFYEKANLAFDTALNLGFDDVAVLREKGIVLFKLDRHEEAILFFDRALDIEPENHESWMNRGMAAGHSSENRATEVFLPLVPQHDVSLDHRGYEGMIASYSVALRHVNRVNNPEGWGLLHHRLGLAHYYSGRSDAQANLYFAKSVWAYEAALTALIAFPESYLSVLESAIRTCLGLHNLTLVREYRQQGLEVFNQLLNAAPTPIQKQRLEQKFSGFSQIQVDSLIHEGNYTQALQTAERYKNRTLGWILDTWQEQITIPSWAEIQTLLTPTTAAIYWHLSPDSLTTFLLTADASAPIAFTQPTAKLETWLKKWNKEYQAYRGKGKAAEANKDFDAWRTSLQGSLNELKTILKISELEAGLQNVSQLLLIPHRDLHRLPLHALFFDSFTTSYLPSLQVGLTLKQRAISTTPRAQLPLLNIADPKGDRTLRLESAQIEATLISQLFEQVDTVRSDRATTQTVTEKLSQPNRIFNFSGHAWAERQPKQSALYLQGEDRLTAETLCQLNLKTYDLITLSACETAVTGLQTIESDYVGLGSAFLTAGAANIISTLWTVESESNAWLMVTFYQHYQAGDSPAIALKKSQHWLRTLTYRALADWLQQQQNQVSEHTHPGTYDAIAARIGDIQADPSKIDSEQPPYADPYYWATFIVTGYPS